MNVKGLVLGAAIVAASSAHGSLTCLINLPIADFLAHREFNHNVSIVGTENHIDPKVYWSHGSTLGIYDKGEIGLTNDFEGAWLYDAKVKLFESKGDHKLLIAGGFTNVSTTDNSIDKFVMARYDAGSLRFHGGYYHSAFGSGVFGVDFGLPQGMSGAVEHQTGPGATTWFALNVLLAGPQLQLLVGAGVPWSRDDGYKYTAAVTYACRF